MDLSELIPRTWSTAIVCLSFRWRKKGLILRQVSGSPPCCDPPARHPVAAERLLASRFVPSRDQPGGRMVLVTAPTTSDLDVIEQDAMLCPSLASVMGPPFAQSMGPPGGCV